MTTDESFLQQDAAELEHFLVQQARLARAPRAAHERALVALASVSLTAGLTTAAKVAWGASAMSKVTPWLVTKWIAVGMTASMTVFAAAEGLHEAFDAPDPSSGMPEQTPPRAQLDRSAGSELTSKSPSAALTAAASSVATPGSAQSRSAWSEPSQAGLPEASPVHLPSSTAFDAKSSAEGSAALAREVARLRRARVSLSTGSPAAALQALTAYAAEFPAGALRAEAAALRIEAVATLGDAGLAQRLASEFLRDFPSSPLAARVRAVSGLDLQRESKP